jgi:hypothetical protein
MAIALPAGSKIYLSLQPVDMRKGFDGLAARSRRPDTPPSPARSTVAIAAGPRWWASVLPGRGRQGVLASPALPSAHSATCCASGLPKSTDALRQERLPCASISRPARNTSATRRRSTSLAPAMSWERHADCSAGMGHIHSSALAPALLHYISGSRTEYGSLRSRD